MQVFCYRILSARQVSDGCKRGYVDCTKVDGVCMEDCLGTRPFKGALSDSNTNEFIGERIARREFGLLFWRYFNNFVRSIFSTSTISNSDALFASKAHIGVKHRSDSTESTYRQRTSSISRRPTKWLRLRPRLVGTLYIDYGRLERLSFYYSYSIQQP